MNIMLYSPDLVGHPQVYCRVITDILIEGQCRVFLVIGFSKKRGVNEYPEILPFVNNEKVEIINSVQMSKKQDKFLSAEEIIDLQNRLKIQSTLFIEADKFREEFIRIWSDGAPRLLGRNVGIFSRTSVWCPGEEFRSGEKIKWYAPTIRGNLQKIKGALFHRNKTDRYFFEKIILKGRILDAILVKDERAVNFHGPPVYWMPEIYKTFDNFEGKEEKREYDEISQKYFSFLSRNKDKEILLFFGRGSRYRGYDLFLKLVEMDSSVCGVNCGAEYRKDRGNDYEYDIESLRTKLLEQGRLFETKRYIESKKLIELFFSTTNKIVSTHRLTASSGTVLQALDFGKPVLVPNSGLLGYRVRKYKLGETYNYYLDINDLYKKWILFKKQPANDYLNAISQFMNKFSKEALTDCICKVLLNGN
jgi:hypothetical protein